MSDLKAMAEERTQLFMDVTDGKIPKRVPVNINIPNEFALQYAGMDLTTAQWDTTKYLEAFDKVCQDFYVDAYPLSALRFPSVYKQLEARNFVMGSNGFIQHPEVEGMAIDDYDAFIDSPYDCIVERILPRLYPALDAEPAKKAITLAKAFKAWYDEMMNAGMVGAQLTEKYGYCKIPFISGFCEAPMDFVADQLRGFKGISMDIRRIPDKVVAAAEAVTPLMIKMGMPPFSPSKYSYTVVPLHMPPYMRPKDFEKLYWPSFKNMVEGLNAVGQPCFVFAEHDWTRYLDYLNELSESTGVIFEFGDPKEIKEKVGQKHVITGLYPLTLLKSGTKQECIDKAKELIDVLAPGGKYMFGLDKVPLTVDSINCDNLRAVLEYVANNANY